MEQISIFGANELFKKMSDPSIKTALTLSEFDYLTIKATENFVPDIISEKLSFESYGVCVYRNNFIFEHTKDTMGKIIQAGIPQFLFKYLMEFDLMPLIDPPSEPSVFKLSDLEFGFVVWLATCGIPILVFIGELTYFWTKYFLKREIDNLTVFYTLFLYLKIQKS